MTLNFTNEDLDNWAEFSGDYNPIHFNHEKAVQYSLGGVVVHGMLALLHMKAQLLENNYAPDKKWLQWKASIKKVIPKESSYIATIEKPSQIKPVKFRMLDSNSGVKHIHGVCQYNSIDADKYSEPGDEYLLDSQYLVQKASKFKDYYPGIDSNWIFLDAAIFSQYINEHSKSVLKEELSEYLGHESSVAPGAENLEFMVMHTHHNLNISPSLYSQKLQTAWNNNQVRYKSIKREIINSGGSLFGTVELPVWINAELVMVMELGLMARKFSNYN